MLIARFDGGCEDNPFGHGACACLIERDGIEIHRASRYLGKGKQMTCNVAEFEGLKMIFKWYLDSGLNEPMNVIGDSQIVIWRMLGKYKKPVTGICAAISNECLELKSWLPFGQVKFEWQGRGNNEECDAMCQLEIDEAQATEKTYA